MHGGTREGSGRKQATSKRKPVTIYLDETEIKAIEDVPLPNHKNLSKKCRELISIGINQIEKNLESNENTVTFIDLFCGLGGIRLGFEQALSEIGMVGKCVFSSDIKPAAIKAYSKNFNHNPECDITKVSPSSIPNFDFMLAGFPCQAFSQAGLGLGFQDTRGTLFFDIAKILMEKKPLGFVLENVEGLVNHDRGKTFKVITKTLKDLGYNIQYEVLNGKDFGLAQSRKRIYIIGYRGEEIEPLKDFDISQSVLNDIIDYNVPPIDSEFSKKLLSKFKIEEIYGKAIKDKRGGNNNIHSWDIGLKGDITDEQSRLLEMILKQRRNKKWADIIGIKWMDGMPLTAKMISSFFDSPYLVEMLDDLVDKGYLSYEYPKQLVGNKRVPDTNLEKGYNIVAGKLSFEFTKILSPFDVTPTLVATDVHKMAVPVKNGIRPLTVKEGLRLFGFPDNYDLSFLKESEAFDLLGNTVCVPVIKAVSNKLLKTYKKRALK
ncbi:DNA (cytosine-5-)-methyltransferase [Streptococcus parasanguinis]|uniref:DNA (cytosine-5-)-methyltransferase n=1 Tax=Streptococcus parasanguinis TaxID=1318 RepID=UPI0012BBF4EF|nr:DNA (cytosine-5-)-methyltransferase [Streptococcus parasanguinis]MTR53080.1 DNA (cytosine-5-)-methyltransferase [Streptococcus parasanguinis]MTR55075.1 DNA (cytosine-5-)-methyltransferase [Streptococcus parasanguinis]MTR59899.1 DNA (cytosine-5-)-methyltransferase [Streptococcus parasanguinis]MTR69526.1 DNA (cytosine-5-)-methyltransferase [Streptococcus parasanguinis]MTS04007.1 DNA (cytosine-5-)-methyltransferase [Streptococcus parasanguinis]